MKTLNRMIVSSVLSFGLVSGLAAQPLTIDDDVDVFIGEGTDSDGVTPLGDTFGGGNYRVAGMDVSNNLSTLFVTVYTNFDEVGSLFDYGDLFIDVDGWTPDGTAALDYADDNASNAGNWDYAVDASSRSGGVADLIDLSGATLLNSSDVITGPLYTRENQEVAYLSGGTVSGAANMSVAPSGSTNALSFEIALADLGLNPTDRPEIGLRWTMTCANDITEGSYTVPEPGTLALLGLGLLGLGLRKRVKG